MLGLVSLCAVHNCQLGGDDGADDVFGVAGGSESFVVIDREVEGGEDAKYELAWCAIDIFMDG